MRSLIVSRLLPCSAIAFVLGGCGAAPQSSGEEQGSTAQALSVAAIECIGDPLSWSGFGQNLCNTRSTPLSGLLSPLTAPKLGVKWSFKAAGDISATPAVVGNELYVPDWGGMLNKLNAQTGQVIWSESISTLIGITAPGPGPNDTPAAVTARDTPIVTPDSVIFGIVGGPALGAPTGLGIVAAVDRQTGALKWKTQVDTHPAAVITSSPVYLNGKVYVGVASGEEVFAALPLLAGIPYTCCSFRGSVVALDAETGAIDWKTYTIENSAYFQSDGVTPSGYAGAAVWSSPTIDLLRGSIYVDTGNNYASPVGSTTLAAGDHVESIIALNLQTGAYKWSHRVTTGDDFTLLDLFEPMPGEGPDFDFGASPNLFHAVIGGIPHDLVGAGQKSGVYYAVDADTGNLLWDTTVGPGGHTGGIHWGTAVDSQSVYVGVNDFAGSSYVLGGTGPQSGQSATVGSWAALNPATGAIKWQVADPALTAENNTVAVNGPVSSVNGVVFGGSMDMNGTMFAFNAATGAVLWSFQSGGPVYSGPAIANGMVYWGNGLPNASRLLFGGPGGTLYAFQVELGNGRLTSN